MARSKLSVDVAKQLEQAIVEGRLLPGDRLPSERTLSEEFGVSRPVLREALGILQVRGLVTIRHGSGSFVKDLDAELSKTPAAVWLAKNEPLVTEFYEARLLIEPQCCELAARRATGEQVARLRQLVQTAEQVVVNGKIPRFIGLDIDFHNAIAEMTGNALLVRMLNSIIHPATDLRKVIHRLTGHLEVAQARHFRILTAIESGDPAAARATMAAALEGALHDIRVARVDEGVVDQLVQP